MTDRTLNPQLPLAVEEHLEMLANMFGGEHGTGVPSFFATIAAGIQGGPCIEIVATFNITIHLPFLPALNLQNQTICFQLFC